MWQGIHPESTRIREWSLDEVKRIVLDHLGDHPARVYLSGSCATGQTHWFSDIDEALEESMMPYFVGVVDLTSASADLRSQVYKEEALWRA